MRTLIRASIALAVLLAVVGTAGGPASAVPLAAPALPKDPNAKGYIGFCDEAGHNVVGGNIATTPFVWKAVASAGPPAAYQGVGQDAVLNAYQPRPGTQPVEWSGSGLIATSVYRNRKNPSVQATYKDSSLAAFVTSFPPRLDGLYVLRMYWGKRNFGIYSATYPVTVIQVQGARWHVVSGGTVDCSRATSAVSMEQLTGVATKRDVTPRAPAGGQSTSPAGSPRRIVGKLGTPTGPTGNRSTGATSDGDPVSGQPSATASASSPSSRSRVLWGLSAAVVLLAAALLLSSRRRRSPAYNPAPAEDEPKDRP